MKKLSGDTLATIQSQPGLSLPTAALLNLPEKVLQFGTGVLLRGLPDYFIDKANKQGIFNGRVVIVKSTSQGGTDAFAAQDGLFTHCIRGLQNGKKVEEDIINASVSRVLSASDEWHEVLACASNPAMEVVISNTTEVGIALLKDDKIDAAPPKSFPGKLLAFLYKRFQVFNGDPSKGLVIVPTELIVGNGEKLESILLELAHLNSVGPSFMDWLEKSNHFCNSLVDRIVPGKLPAADKTAFVEKYQYNDDLMIMSEPYSLWAIEARNAAIKEKLSFYKTDKGVAIAPDINKFRELKLRLLNGTHTNTCGLAFLAGFGTVKQAMDDAQMEGFVRNLMLHEIAPTIVGNDISEDDAKEFAESVIDRFRNPFIEHQWLSITVQYSGKMKMRNLPTLLKHYEKYSEVPQLMSLGFAAYIAFMQVSLTDGKYTGTLNGRPYIVQDDRAEWFANLYSNASGSTLVETVLKDQAFWETDLSLLPGFAKAVSDKYLSIVKGDIRAAHR